MLLELSPQILQGIFLIMLTIIGGVAESTFSCQTLKLLHTNMFAKQFVIICLIYFTIDFTDNKNSHPLDTLKNTIVIWIAYIVMSKQNIHFTITIFLLLVSLYIIQNYLEYLEDEKNHSQNKHLQDKLKQSSMYIKYILVGISFIGFVLYFIKERKEHKKNYSLLKFIFGANKCDHDK